MNWSVHQYQKPMMEEGAVPREFGILAGAHEVGHRVAEVIDGLGAADIHHRVPAAEFLEAEPQDDEGADEQDRGLQDGSLQDGFHTADDGVDSGDDHQGEGRNPEVDAQEGVQREAAGEDGHGHLGEDVAGEGEPSGMV